MASYELAVSCRFNGAHFLRRYEGKCKRLHGHSYEVTALFTGEALDERGMLVDFGEAKAWLNEAVERFDHTLLNDLPEFQSQNPTAENLARVIFEALARIMDSSTVTLASLSVAENPGSFATYRG